MRYRMTGIDSSRFVATITDVSDAMVSDDITRDLLPDYNSGTQVFDFEVAGSLNGNSIQDLRSKGYEIREL